MKQYVSPSSVLTMSDRASLQACTLIICIIFSLHFLGYAGSPINIRPQACSNAMGDVGTCMFVWQCIKMNGEQLGPCVDRFLVGACCRLPAEEDNIVPGASGVASPPPVKPKPPPTPSPPSSTTTTSTTTTTTTTTRPTPSVISSTPLTIHTIQTSMMPGMGTTNRPIVSPLVGQSVVDQTVSVPEVAVTTEFVTDQDYSECGVSTARVRGKVVGGGASVFGQWPWQVSVRRSSFFGFASTHRCGGAILNANWVATAAHCVDDLLKSQVRIRVGEYDFSTIQEPFPHQERGVERKVVHPRYNFFTYEHDLALLHLDAPLVLQPHIRPICLPPDTATEEKLIGVNATVTGWGRLSEGGPLPTKLQMVEVPIMSNSKCQQMFQTAGRQESIPDIFLCAGYESGGRDSCQGDSGGPLQAKGDDGKWFLAGIISWGIGCAEPNMPGVCTRITKFKEWILENIS